MPAELILEAAREAREQAALSLSTIFVLGADITEEDGVIPAKAGIHLDLDLRFTWEEQRPTANGSRLSPG
ncbi:hypothetical protein FQY83_17165 [Luteimonas marina]|uniref:Uncharacterized protein n=1 Tax=Luteimonas marina TaxID=488485 RepID=A0A5C5TV22_9GAMM|nr:hypothetical protein FQY83_17165 [Luteimonas marina]